MTSNLSDMIKSVFIFVPRPSQFYVLHFVLVNLSPSSLSFSVRRWPSYFTCRPDAFSFFFYFFMEMLVVGQKIIEPAVGLLHAAAGYGEW